MIESAQDKHIRELEDALAATDKLLADIQHRVAQLENHTASQDQINEIHAWFAHLQQRVEVCEQAQKGAIFCKPESIIGIVPTQPTYNLTVDILHKRIAYLEKELAAANAEANLADYEENKLRKRVADLEGQLQLAQSEFTCSPVKDIKWVSTADEEIESLKAEINQLSYDRDTLAKRLADILSIAKKDT